jgi:hypothetical protein
MIVQEAEKYYNKLVKDITNRVINDMDFNNNNTSITSSTLLSSSSDGTTTKFSSAPQKSTADKVCS